MDCDWTEGAVKEIGLEDMIGSGLGDGQLLTNQRGRFSEIVPTVAMPLTLVDNCSSTEAGLRTARSLADK